METHQVVALSIVLAVFLLVFVPAWRRFTRKTTKKAMRKLWKIQDKIESTTDLATLEKLNRKIGSILCFREAIGEKKRTYNILDTRYEYLRANIGEKKIWTH